jgi:hypothetical protein
MANVAHRGPKMKLPATSSAAANTSHAASSIRQSRRRTPHRPSRQYLAVVRPKARHSARRARSARVAAAADAADAGVGVVMPPRWAVGPAMAAP